MVMKDISLPSHIFVEHLEGTEADFQAAALHAGEARRNANKVLSAGLFVEREIEAIIANYLHVHQSEQKTFLTRHVLGSDALSFAAKRRVVLTLVREQGWLSGKELDSLDDQLRKVMSFRNALTHGNIIEKTPGTVLEYFEGKPREELLDDAYWDKVVATFDAVTKHLESIKARGSAPPA